MTRSEKESSNIVSAREVFGRRAAYYVTSATHNDPNVLARIVELAAPLPEDHALDIGTGTGHTALALAPHVKSVIGLDLTAEMLAEAETLRLEQAVPNVSWILADVHRLPFEDRVFGLVACRRAAHHFVDMQGSLKEMRRMLGPGGRLSIDDRSVPEDAELDALLNQLDRLHDPSHVRQYRASEWKSLLEEAGFIVDAVEVYTQHRPITTLTEDVPADDVAKIHALVKAMPPDQKAALHVERQDDMLYFDHYYLLVGAHVPQ